MDWTAFLSTSGLLLLAELGDKTQLAVIAQTCRYRRPWAVFLGASVALTSVTALGVLAGQLLGWLVPQDYIRWAAAAGFVLMGGWLAWEAWKAAREAEQEACEVAPPPSTHPDWRAFGTTFGLLFLAEMGDKTQLAVLARSSESAAPVAVFAGSVLAMVAVTALGVAGGQGLVRIIPERYLRWLSAVAFIVMGVLIGTGIL